MLNSKLDEALIAGYISNLGKEIVDKMIALYQQQSALYLQDISKAQQENSQLLWQEHCHKMKGAAGSVGLIALHAMLVNIEKSTEAHEIKHQYVKALLQENEESVAAFHCWLGKQ